MLVLRLLQRTYEGRKRRPEILGQIRIEDRVERFVFGLNRQTFEYAPSLSRHASVLSSLVDKNHGVFSRTPEGYTYESTSQKGTWLRTKVSFWRISFGEREGLLQRNDPMQIKVGDKLIFKGGAVELVIEVADIR